MAKLVMNDLRKKVLKTLKESETPLTLKEISEKIGVEVKTGSTNALLTNGVIQVVGTKKVPVTTYKEVNVYAIGDLSQIEKSE